jgi:hypothetical protein
MASFACAGIVLLAVAAADTRPTVLPAAGAAAGLGEFERKSFLPRNSTGSDFDLGTLVATLSPRLRRRAKYLDEGVVREPRIPARRLDVFMTEEPLELALRHAAPDRVRGEAVLRALVERDVGKPGRLDDPPRKQGFQLRSWNDG